MPTTSSKRWPYDLIMPEGSSRKTRSTRNSGTNIVIRSRLASFDESADRRIFRYRLEQFQIRIADADESGLHTLRLDGLDRVDREAEGRVDAGGFERPDRDADVVESGFDHQTPRASAPQICLCNCVCSRDGRRSASIDSASDFKFISAHTGDISTVRRFRFRSPITLRGQS